MLSTTTLPFSSAAIYQMAGSGMFFVYDHDSGKTLGFPESDVENKSGYMLVCCRTSFAWGWQQTKLTPGATWPTFPFRPDIRSWIGYKAKTLDIEAFAARWDDMEVKLGIPSADRTVLHRAADQPNVVIMKLSPFWMANDTTRSFATLFMRMLIDYWRGSFDNSVAAYTLAKYIAPAIAWFMAGNTRPLYARMTLVAQGVGMDSACGVVNQFVRATTPEQLSLLLARPVSP